MKKVLLALSCVMIFGLGSIFAQTRTITGTITGSDDGYPVPGASVMVKGTSIGTVAQSNGAYSLNVPQDAEILIVSFIGMQTQEIGIAGRSVIDVILESGAIAMDEVIVTGYGVTKKAAFTGAASVISGVNLENRNDANPIKSLEGAVPGLQFNLSSGQPGAPATIYIRGRNSLNSGTQPLYIIDGVPFSADAVGVRSDEEQQISPLSTINASDIESMTVLKDATATSIYGARAANGVIIITTKKGKSGKTRVNFTAKLGFETLPAIPKSYQLTNRAEYTELAVESFLNAYDFYGVNSSVDWLNGALGLNAPYTKEGMTDLFSSFMTDYYGVYIDDNDTDWLKAVTRKGFIQEYGFDIQGGAVSETAPKYFFSFNYMDQESLVRGKDLSRYSMRFNFDQSPSKIVNFGMNTNFSLTESNMGAGGGYFTDPITQAFMQSPWTPVKYPNGEWNFDTPNGYNPVAQRSELGDKSTAKQYRAIISPFLQLNLNKDLFFLSKVGADIYFVDEFGYWSFLQPQGADMRGMGENNYTTRTLFSITNTLNYIKTFNDNHNVNLMLGQEYQSTSLKEAYLAASNYPVDYLNQVANAAVPGSAATYKYELKLASFFANAQYDYDGKYYLSGSFRYDGSSRFGINNRWAPFWSLGAKYRISSESFMEGTSDWLNNLTARASYGTSGNQEVGNVRYYSSWYVSKDLFGFGYNYNGLPGSGHYQFGNPDLKWEQTAKFNIGIDATFLNRITVEADYYNHMTKDMVFAVPQSRVTGLTSYYQNLGELSNKGFEVLVSTQIINKNDFRWILTLTGSHNKNNVEKLSDGNPIETSYQITEVGQPLWTFKMREWAGVDPQTGAGLWYKGTEGREVTDDYNEAGKRYLGDANPDFIGSISNTINWKGFDFSLQLNYSLGAKIFGNSLRYDEQLGGSLPDNFTKYVYDNRWQKPGDNAKVPALIAFDSGYENSASSRFLMNGDYLKIRSLSIGYTLPKSVIEKAYMSNVRIFVNAENLYTFTDKDYRGFDPAGIAADGLQWWNFPLPRSIAFGVTVGF